MSPISLQSHGLPSEHGGGIPSRKLVISNNEDMQYRRTHCFCSIIQIGVFPPQYIVVRCATILIHVKLNFIIQNPTVEATLHIGSTAWTPHIAARSAHLRAIPYYNVNTCTATRI